MCLRTLQPVALLLAAEVGVERPLMAAALEGRRLQLERLLLTAAAAGMLARPCLIVMGREGRQGRAGRLAQPVTQAAPRRLARVEVQLVAAEQPWRSSASS